MSTHFSPHYEQMIVMFVQKHIYRNCLGYLRMKFTNKIDSFRMRWNKWGGIYPVFYDTQARLLLMIRKNYLRSIRFHLKWVRQLFVLHHWVRPIC